MTNKNNTFRYFLAAVAGAVAVLVFVFAAPNDFGLGRNMEIVINMMRELSLGYVDPIDPDRLAERAAEGMVNDLDPYTEYIPEKKKSDFELLTTGKYGGVGSLIRQKEDYVRIAQPYQNSPADRAGLKIGDRIIAIDGKDAKGFSAGSIKTNDFSQQGKDQCSQHIKEKYNGNGLRDIVVLRSNDGSRRRNGGTSADGRAYTYKDGSVFWDVQQTAQNPCYNQRSGDGAYNDGKRLLSRLEHHPKIHAKAQQHYCSLKDVLGSKLDPWSSIPFIGPEQGNDHSDEDRNDRPSHNGDGFPKEPCGNSDDKAYKDS